LCSFGGASEYAAHVLGIDADGSRAIGNIFIPKEAIRGWFGRPDRTLEGRSDKKKEAVLMIGPCP